MRLKTEIELKMEGKGCNRGSGVWRKSVDRRRERKEGVTHRMALGTSPEAQISHQGASEDQIQA